MKKIDMIGKKFGKLTVKSEHSKTRNGHTRYVCECDCGSTSNVLGTHLRQGNTISCGCSLKRRGKNNKGWSGVGEMSGDFWYNHVYRSASGSKGRREIPLLIDKEYAWGLFLSQNKKCALTGEPLSFPKGHGDKTWTASLDRINSEEGYIQGNVQWVHKDVNVMKNKFNQEYFVSMCKKVAQTS